MRSPVFWLDKRHDHLEETVCDGYVALVIVDSGRSCVEICANCGKEFARGRRENQFVHQVHSPLFKYGEDDESAR